ncbi:MAG TPA: hypothetical protein VF988_04935 [Verrucomicrobiae bacterium]
MKTLRPQIQLSNGKPGFRATLAAEIRVLDQARGIVQYVASDETIDSYKEIVRVTGWDFSLMEKNAPFVDTHSYHSIKSLLGEVLDWRIDTRRNALVETVKWAKDVPSNDLAKFGWDMIQAGFGPKAVSVGFMPCSYVTKWDNDPTGWHEQLAGLGLQEEDGVRVIYTAQQQIELSACILGANPNALQLAAKAYKAGAIDDGQIEFLSRELAQREPVASTDDSAAVDAARQQARQRISERIRRIAAKF